MSTSGFTAAILLQIVCLFPAHSADLVASWQAARTHDAAYSAAKNALAAGMEYAAQGNAAVLPQLTLTSSAIELKTDYQPGQESGKTPSSSALGQQYALNLLLSQPIYDSAATVKRDEFRKQAAQAELQFRIAEQDLMLRVAKAYFEVLVARQNLALVNSQKEGIALQLAMAKTRFRIGSATITDTNDAQARYDAILANEITTLNDLSYKSGTYRRLTGLDPEQLQPASETRQPSAPEAADLTTWLAQAADASLSVKAQQLGLDIAAMEIDRYRLETAPTLSLVAKYGGRIDAPGISQSGGRDMINTSSIGLQLTVPLYTGGARSSQFRQAVALREQQKDNLEAARRDAEENTRLAFLGVTGAAAQIKALEQARISGASSVASSKRGRDVGVRTTVDVLNAEQSYYQTLFNLVAARYQYLLSKLQLAASIGRLDESELTRVNDFLSHHADTVG
ncbi:MAG: TolC family outer membrane protein [Betaproteobacteria bacterium]